MLCGDIRVICIKTSGALRLDVLHKIHSHGKTRLVTVMSRADSGFGGIHSAT
jgi:hypothetical protein